MKRVSLMILCLALVLITFAPELSAQDKKSADKAKKPNIVVIWGDDIGISNLSAFS
jgi:hypothetical protein